MKPTDKKTLKKGLAILKTEFGYPKWNCKKHTMGCLTCHFKRFIEDFESLIDFVLDE